MIATAQNDEIVSSIGGETKQKLEQYTGFVVTKVAVDYWPFRYTEHVANHFIIFSLHV